jgi:hypothetical protein
MVTIKTVMEKQAVQIKSDAKHRMYLYLLDYVSKNCKFLEISLETNIRMEYIGDFYGLLKYNNANSQLDYLNLLINNLNSSNEYDGVNDTIYILDETDQKINVIMEKLKKL